MGIDLLHVDQTWTLFLDRDGVINQRIFGGYVLSTESFVFEQGVLPALKSATQRFGRIIVVTNQQCVALGLLSDASLAQIHQDMITEVTAYGGRIDAVYEIDGRYEVIDWKTGSTKLGPSSAVQLAVYRLAWAKLKGIDSAHVSAAFHYVPSGQTDRSADLLTETELIKLLSQ